MYVCRSCFILHQSIGLAFDIRNQHEEQVVHFPSSSYLSVRCLFVFYWRIILTVDIHNRDYTPPSVLWFHVCTQLQRSFQIQISFIQRGCSADTYVNECRMTFNTVRVADVNRNLSNYLTYILDAWLVLFLHGCLISKPYSISITVTPSSQRVPPRSSCMCLHLHTYSLQRHVICEIYDMCWYDSR